MRFGSLFAGIGGFDLGLERAGLAVRWQVENDERCNRVLARHWPYVARFGDVRRVDGRVLEHVDLIAGGFPCTDISDASRGRGGGIDGERSGLWREMVRIVDDIRPRWVLVENVGGAAAKRWVPVVRRALHERGYPSVPIRVRGVDVGARYDGARIYVAAADRDGESARAVHAKVAELRTTAESDRPDRWQPPSCALGVADGIPDRMERLAAVGNAVDPRIAEMIGRAILRVERSE